MYLVTYSFANQEEIGVLSTDKKRVIPVNTVIRDNPPRSMQELIERFNSQAYDRLKEAEGQNTGIEIDRVVLLAPIPHPVRGVICLGKNYQGHVQEMADAANIKAEVPEHPVYFYKMVNRAVEDGGLIPSHSEITRELDYEVELAVVMGKRGYNIPEDRAQEYIFGYTILNDITARNLQKEHLQWFRGKSLDGTCPMGPYLVHKSAINFPPELDVKCFVNHELRQNDNTRNLIYSIRRVVSEISRGLTLKPGDIISTGTPAGVGMGYNPPRFLQKGDKVECYIEKIGTLTNYIE